MAVLRGIAALAAAALGSAAVSASPDRTAPRAPMTIDAARAAVAAVEQDVASIRGLPFRQPVPVEVVDEARARRHVLERVSRFLPAERIAGQERAWRLLGLLPAGTDMLAEVLAVLDEQAGGYYDPATKSFVLLDDAPRALAIALAAHELTHALDDQHFDLDRRLATAIEDDDVAFARSAVHEGTATLVMTVVLARAVAAGTLTRDALEALAESEAGRGERLRAMPDVLRRELLGPYVLGPAFLLRGDLGRLGNVFPAADTETAYRAGPTTSEQVLHPEKFWDPASRDDPSPVTIDGLQSVLGRRWTKSGDGVLGEMRLAVLAGSPPIEEEDWLSKAADPRSWTNRAATGWDGDRWELWTRGRRAVVVLSTIWDSVCDAEEFEAAIAGRGRLRARREGNRVAIVAGASASNAEALLGHLIGRPFRSNRRVPPGNTTARTPLASSDHVTGSSSLP